ncbi:MAG: dihydrofolate reductase [Anaerolineae bacterium]|nr:dihydrofolate reductase [Anaerolineae bacterium]
MLVSLIAALDDGNGIGLKGALPWQLPDDMRSFKKLTMQHHVIMGRKTYESIGRVLPGREMLVVTQQTDYQAPGCQVLTSLEAAIKTAQATGEREVFIIGGQSLYRQALPLADRLYLTFVHARLDADVFFPEINFLEWKTLECVPHAADDRHLYAFDFKVLERIKRYEG